MALASTAPLLNIQDAGGVTLSPSNGGTAVVGAGDSLTLSLTNGTSGLQAWTVQAICPAYPSLHQKLLVDWRPGMATSVTIPMPALPIVGQGPQNGVALVSTVSDGSGGAVPSSTHFLQTKGVGGSAMPMQTYADYVIVASLPTYTNTNGVLTGNSNGAVTSAMADGATPAVGDIFLLEQGLAASAADAGLCVLTAVGSGSAKFSAQAIGFGQTMLPKAEILVGSRGTVFKNTTWVNTLTGYSNVVGTASFTFFPRFVTWNSAAVAGINTAGASATTGAPGKMSVFSTTLSNLVIVRTTPSGTASTVDYAMNSAGMVAGGLGTGAASAFATVAAGTVNASDVSTLSITLINPV